MKRNQARYSAAYFLGAAGLALVAMALAAMPKGASAIPPAEEPAPPAAERPLPTVNEARDRAELLHETLHATLQAVHHQYFREDEGLRIPATTLSGVFREVARRQKVEFRWLAVNAEPMNVDHRPRNEFEKQAAAAIASGQDGFEQVEGDVYRRAGTITLTSDCLGCHSPNRTSNNDRAAALVIAIPIQKQ